MQELYIPTLHTFEMNNIFTGSCGDFRFRIEPNVIKKTQKEVDLESSSIKAAYWHGQFCYDLSQMEGEETFPMSEVGRLQMKQWLESNI